MCSLLYELYLSGESFLILHLIHHSTGCESLWADVGWRALPAPYYAVQAAVRKHTNVPENYEAQLSAEVEAGGSQEKVRGKARAHVGSSPPLSSVHHFTKLMCAGGERAL